MRKVSYPAASDHKGAIFGAGDGQLAAPKRSPAPTFSAGARGCGSLCSRRLRVRLNNRVYASWDKLAVDSNRAGILWRDQN